uniref:protein-tyrosine-phosphatase n=1 Tax=Clytia hemisphaerica TaxID=252671 RepID=A0A7M6DKX7_9CNID
MFSTTRMSPLTPQFDGGDFNSMMRPKVPKSLDLFNSSTSNDINCSCPTSSPSKKRPLKRIEGGFSEFAYKFPKLCDSKIKSNCPLLSISTPCASAGSINCPPTKILPFLYLGCEEDALSEDILKTCHVKYVLNASHSAVDSPYCTTGRYLRIPIKDNSSENIVAWFQTAFDFIDKVKESDDHILIHCVGGVSRSATIAIAYVMKHFSLSLD